MNEQRKFSFSFSLTESQIKFIRTFSEGPNDSANLRTILNKAQEESADLVRYDDLDCDNPVPAYVNRGAINVYSKTSDTINYDDSLVPFEIPKRSKPEAIAQIAERAGYRAQIVAFAEIGFEAVWVMSKQSACSRCKGKIRATVEVLLSEIAE